MIGLGSNNPASQTKKSIRLFLGISLFFGLIYIFIIPPFQAPDEDNHFFRCMELYNSFESNKRMPTNRLGSYLPKDLKTYADQFLYLRFNYDAKISKQELKQKNRMICDESEITFVDYSNTAMYLPTAYVLQSLVAGLATRMNAKPATLLYLMRMASLLTWLLIMFYALKIFSSSNQVFIFISLLPALLVLHCSYYFNFIDS